MGKKRKLIIKRGEFLLPLLTAALSVLLSFIRLKIDMDARNERRRIRSLLKKNKNVHPYYRWIKLRKVQGPLLRRAVKKRRAITLSIYETEATGSRYVDTSIQVYRDDAADSYEITSCLKTKRLRDSVKLISGE